MGNTPMALINPEQFQEFLEDEDMCPSGKKKLQLDTMIKGPQWERPARTEEESVQHLRFILATHEATTLAVVTHGGVIKALTGLDADNCSMVECILFEHWQAPMLKCVQVHGTPHREATT